MDLHPDFRDLLAEFARQKVSYAVIGGYAVGRHAKPRATKDLDLLVSASGDNLERAGPGAAHAPRVGYVMLKRKWVPRKACRR
jgi:hypothetical protein